MRPSPRLLLAALGLVACSGSDPATTQDATSTGDPTSTGSSSTTGAPTTSGSTATGDATTTGDPTSTGDDTTTGAGCPAAPLAPGEHIVAVDHGGMMRTARVHVPASVDPQVPAPLVLNFHGFGSNASQQQFFSGMSAFADSAGFLLVYPQGFENSWNAGACCGEAVTQDIDDVGFVRALVAALAEKLCFDPRRVYATGMSNGGFISHRLACEAADLIAAAGPVSATVVIDPCVPGRPIPVMMFNGTADFLVPYDGGLYQSAPKSFSDWSDRNGCTDPAEVSAQVGAVTCETRDECDDGVAVTLCTVEGMGHCWPGNPSCLFGTANTDMSANEALWAFFSQFTLP